MARDSLLLESNDGITKEILTGNRTALTDDFRMFAAEQPADMGEEEASGGIVRISIGFRVLVVDTMIA